MRAKNGAKDELEQATNWVRPFADILVRTRWLDSYCSTNLSVANKLIKKFLKAVWKTQRIKYESDLKEYTNTIDYAKPTKVREIKNDLLEYFAKMFTNGNRRAARRMLDKVHPKTRTKDVYLSLFFLGMTISLLTVGSLFLFLPGNNESTMDWIYSVIPVFRYLFTINLCLFATGFAIKFFRMYAINYILIFELDTDYRIRESQIYRISMLIFYIWLICAFLQVVVYKYDIIQIKAAIFAFVLFIIMNVILISPFKALYSGARGELLVVMWNIFTSPLSKVGFKEFFLADIFTSLARTFQDMATTICFFTTPSWTNNTDAKCPWLQSVNLLIPAIPFLWRFLQCLHKYYDTRDVFPHLVNAGRHSITISTWLVNLASILYNLGWEKAFIVGNVIVTLAAYIWELTMDWGLLRSSKENYGLRKRILYPAKFYYFAMVTNGLLRLAWIIPICQDKYFNNIGKGYAHLIFFGLTIAEAFRRAQWALFRVENENVNNFEKYRSFLEIPQLAEEEQD